MGASSQVERLIDCDIAEYHAETQDVDAESFDEAKVFNERISGLVGVAVVNDAEEILLIRHEGYGGWVLPGGVAERSEDLSEAAIREVSEETGVTTSIDHPLLIIEFVTRHEDRSTAGYFVLFEGTAIDTETADDPGMEDEPITDVRWLDSIPEETPDDETVQHALAVVEDRFDWLD